MKAFSILILLLSVFEVQASSAVSVDQCASMEALAKQTGQDAYKVMRDMGLHDLADKCQSLDTTSAMKEMASGPMYCQSGSLCAKYEFEYASDRKLYAPKCAPVRTCRADYTDKCEVRNDDVKGGRGKVDWTLYAYNTSKKIWDDAKGVNCR